MNQTTPTFLSRLTGSRRALATVETTLIFVLLFVFAGSPPPGDDEAHYLGKAKHSWNPAWLAGDFFLETPDAHVLFNWAIGWLTLFFSLAATAWIGRCAAWLLLAIAWQRLSFAIVPRPLVSLLTMGLFLVFQQYGTAAREWIVGGVEAKCFAWALVVFALEQLVRTSGCVEGFRVQGSGFREKEDVDELWRWNLVWPLLGFAAAFHVLVGGWAVVAALLTWLATKHRPTFASMLPSVVVGGLVSLLGVIPALLLSWHAEPEVVRQANQIYVFERLNHHLVMHDFPWQYRLQFLGTLAAWLFVVYVTRATTRAQPLQKFVLGSLVIAIVGIVIDQATLMRPEIAAALLRFYWFRLADMLVPIGLAFALVEAYVALENLHRRAAQALLIALCLMPMAVIGRHAVERFVDRRSGAETQAGISSDDVDDWRSVCMWVERQTPQASRFLTPPLYQCFRWHAERSEVASWKDIPQNAAGIVEWHERMRVTRAWWAELQQHGFTPRSERLLRQLADKYDVHYIVVPRALTAKPLGLTPLFSNATSTDDKVARGYTVYWIGPGDSASPPASARSISSN